MDLGLVLLDCMEDDVTVIKERTIESVRQQRKDNKVFGLSNPEQWSGCKQLVDFLDDLFNEDRTAAVKFSRPVCSSVTAFSSGY